MRFIALPVFVSLVLAGALLVRYRRRHRTSFRRAHDVNPVSEEWLADRRRSD
jgi:hypothetical protein